MAFESNLPTIAEMFTGAAEELSKAYKALGGAADWLRSDWRPLGSSLTNTQAAAKTTVYDQIGEAKRAINAAHDAINSTRSPDLERLGAQREATRAEAAAVDDGSEVTP